MSNFNFSTAPSADGSETVKDAVDLALEVFNSSVGDSQVSPTTVATENYVDQAYAQMNRLQQAHVLAQNNAPPTYIGNKRGILREVSKFCAESLKMVPDETDADVTNGIDTFFVRYKGVAGPVVSNESYRQRGSEIASGLRQLISDCGVGTFNQVSTLQCALRDLVGQNLALIGTKLLPDTPLQAPDACYGNDSQDQYDGDHRKEDPAFSSFLVFAQCFKQGIVPGCFGCLDFFRFFCHDSSFFRLQ